MERETRRAIGRREFLGKSALAGIGLAAAGSARVRGAPAGGPVDANDRFVIGVMGLGRGLGHIQSALDLPYVDLAYVCDVDRRRVDRALGVVREKSERAKPKGIQDYRNMLDDPAVDVICIAACNHWHAPATVLSCKAGKHVYVEKPGSHNAREGELMVGAARKHSRVVQMGNQRRSHPLYIEAMEKLREGAIGTLRFARCWYNNRRPSIGRGKSVPVPEPLDYSLWQGPAPERPYKDNLIHYNWHWHWHWGGGELANNGVHALDIARWGLEVDAPLRVTYNGGRYHHDDDQETPDTGTATYDFGGRGASWEHSSCHPRRSERHPFVSFYGDGGTLEISDSRYTIYDLDGKETGSGRASGGLSTTAHIRSLLEAIRSGGQPTAEIEDAQRSTLLCHLGNIAYRTGRTIHFGPEARAIRGDAEAARLWGREYREGWELSA